MMQGAIVPEAEPRPWDRLNLPEDIRLALFPAPVFLAPAVPRPWDRLILPEDFRLVLFPASEVQAAAIHAPANAAPNLAAADDRMGAVIGAAHPQPWDRLQIPEDIRLALNAAPAAPAPQRVLPGAC